MILIRYVCMAALGIITLNKSVTFAQCDIAIEMLQEEPSSQITNRKNSSKSRKKSVKGSRKKSAKGRKQGKADLRRFSDSCNEATEITVSQDGIINRFKMDKRPEAFSRHSGSAKDNLFLPREEENDSSINPTSEQNLFLSGEEENGSSINLLRKPNGQIFGSMTNVNDDTVMHIRVDVNGTNVVEITPSSEFRPEADAVFEVEPSVLPSDEPSVLPSDEPSVLQTSRSAPPQSNSGERLLFDRVAKPSVTRRVNTFVTIDVLVLWTKDAECENARVGSGCTRSTYTKGVMDDLIEAAISETNVAYEKSGVELQLRLVHSELVDHINEPVNNAFGATLTAIRNDSIVAERRATYGADVVALLIHDNQYCGMAYLGPAINNMFSVTAHNCATGYFSFGHEIGHNLGLNHDRGTKNSCASTNYNYGYRAPEGDVRTIMAYNCRMGQCDNIQKNGCTRIQRFSNLHTEYKGKWLGASNANNARKLNDEKEKVSNYYSANPSKVPTHTPSISTNPSSVPSLAPSFSMAPSLEPTHMPSVRVRVSTHMPSVSANPSEASSNAPSISTSPSIRPSDVPSSSMAPFSVPSNLPSMSVNPSGKPTVRTCDNDPDFEFTLDNKKIKGCEWFTKQSSKMNWRQGKYCGRATINRENEQILISRACCDACTAPTERPSVNHSEAPSNTPSISVGPSFIPLDVPSFSMATGRPSVNHSEAPSNTPSISVGPSFIPSDVPSLSMAPSSVPSNLPSISVNPSSVPSNVPSMSVSPSIRPSNTPSSSIAPSAVPSNLPNISTNPSSVPRTTANPSSEPPFSMAPSSVPSNVPSMSTGPSFIPSDVPSFSMAPSSVPTHIPSVSANPSGAPSNAPSISANPSIRPSVPSSSMAPSSVPSNFPNISVNPTGKPTVRTCDNDLDFEFTLDNGNKQDCRWLTKRSSKTNRRQGKYCGDVKISLACCKACIRA